MYDGYLANCNSIRICSVHLPMQEDQGQPSHGSSQLSAPQEKDGTEHLQLQVQYMHEKPICTLYCIVLYCIVLYCIVLYCIVLYCIVLYCIVLYCIVLYCIVLYTLLLSDATYQ